MIWVDNARIVAIIAVIFIHTAASVVSKSDVGSQYWWIGNFYDSFARWGVPVFVMISGALLLDPSKKEENFKNFYTKRLSKILVPILFWSFFFLLWAMLKGTMGTVNNSTPSLVDLLKKLLLGKPHYHMWFLYMLIGLYFFTPFFRKIITNSTRQEIWLFVFASFLLAALNATNAKLFTGESKLFINWFLSYIPYFFLGHLIRTDERNFSKTILWGIFFLSSCSTALGCYIVAIIRDLDSGLYFYDSLSITVIPMSVSIMYLLRSWASPIMSENFTRALSLLTLGLYLIHPIFIDTIQYLGFGPLNFYPAVTIPIVAITVFSSSLIGSWIIYKVPYLKRII